MFVFENKDRIEAAEQHAPQLGTTSLIVAANMGGIALFVFHRVLTSQENSPTPGPFLDHPQEISNSSCRTFVSVSTWNDPPSPTWTDLWMGTM